jgi:hypothetical protein
MTHTRASLLGRIGTVIVVIPRAASRSDHIYTIRLRIYVGRRFAVRDLINRKSRLCQSESIRDRAIAVRDALPH